MLGLEDVCVVVLVVGFNFCDIMVVIGLLLEEVEMEFVYCNLGFEYGGIVVEVGFVVFLLVLGDCVMGMGKWCF